MPDPTGFWDQSENPAPSDAEPAKPNGKHGPEDLDQLPPSNGEDEYGFATDGLPVITIEPGEIDRLATEGERAIKASPLPVYQRGGSLVRPISQEVPAAHGRTTVAASFQEITTPAMIDVLAQSAKWVVLNRRRRKVVPTDPPTMVAAIILSRAGYWTVPSVAGIITTPTLRPSGELLSAPGYDPETRLYHVADPSLGPVQVKDEPTRQDALEALALLNDLLDGFPFTGKADKAVAFSTLITPAVRGALPVVPLHAVRASTAGTGKSYLVDLASSIATGRPCPVATAAQREEETEKRIVGMILAGFPLVSIDNVNGALGSDLLCQVVERPLVRVRPLGGSEIVEIENRATFLATGNSLRVRGDMTRRTILCGLDAGVERPELRSFASKPVEIVMGNRAKYVSACLIIVRAYITAGLPDRLDPLASFYEWSALVRSALVWLGCADPVDTMEAAREDDPELADLREVLGLWQQHVGLDASVTALRLSERACERSFNGLDNEWAAPEFRDALLRIAGERGQVNTRRLASWIRNREGRIVLGVRLKRMPTLATGGLMQWQLGKA